MLHQTGAILVKAVYVCDVFNISINKSDAWQQQGLLLLFPECFCPVCVSQLGRSEAWELPPWLPGLPEVRAGQMRLVLLF